MDDLISRQASGCEYWDSESNFCSIYRPSAERRGRWETEITTNRDGTKSARYACSVCGVMALDEWHYCPNCGADMREAKNGCDDCFIPMFYNLEDDDSICRDCEVGE